MPNFIGAVEAPNDSPKTLQELIAAAIALRTYSADGPTNLKLIAEEQARFTGVALEVVINPVAATRMINAYKGVLNGVVDPAEWTGTDFTAAGGAETLAAGESRVMQSVPLGGVVIYQAAGAGAVIDLAVTTR